MLTEEGCMVETDLKIISVPPVLAKPPPRRRIFKRGQSGGNQVSDRAAPKQLHSLVSKLQAVIRGHLARKRLLECLPRTTECSAVDDLTLAEDEALPMTAGHWEEVVIRSKDQFGNFRVCGGDDFSVQCSGKGAGTFQYRVTDHKNGTYSIHFCVRAAGKAMLTVQLLGKGGPVTVAQVPVQVLPSVCDLASSVVQVPAEVLVGVPVLIQVQGRDQYGNAVEAAAAGVTIQVVPGVATASSCSAEASSDAPLPPPPDGLRCAPGERITFSTSGQVDKNSQDSGS